jgi:hypothetical protein
MATKCFSVVRGKRVRVTELDDCGEPLFGGDFVVSDGFVQVALTAELEEGDEYIQKNADGRLCINLKNPDSLKRLNVTVDWCNVDPELISVVTGLPVELDGADAVGFRIQSGEYDKKWALEVWTGLGEDSCDEAGDLEYGYLLVPFVTGSTFGDITIANATTTFQTMGFTKGNSGWGVGVYDVIGSPPGPLDDPMGPTDLALLRVTTVAPPAAVCGAQTITSP